MLGKMESSVVEILAPYPPIGEFNLEDFISDSWIDDTAFTVPNLGLLQPDCTAESVLEEAVPSPTSSGIGSNDELHSSFLENFINLAAFELGPNPWTDTDLVSSCMPSFLNDFLDSSGEDVLQDEPVPSSDECVVDVETVETDSVALVPDVFEKICLLPSDDLVDSSELAVAEDLVVVNTLPLWADMVVDPALLLDGLEYPTVAIENKVIPARKRSSEETISSSAPKKSKSSKSSCSSSSEDASPSPHNHKVVQRRKKNNEASKVCRASRKARHQEVFDRENELIGENKKLTVEVDELLNKVKFLRNYLVQKLSTKSS